MKKTVVLLVIILSIIFLVSCAAGPNQLVDTPDAAGEIAGFWQGLWHGIIAPVTFIISQFSDSVHMYEVHNSGGWYNFGFLFGMIIIFGGGGNKAGRS